MKFIVGHTYRITIPPVGDMNCNIIHYSNINIVELSDSAFILRLPSTAFNSEFTARAHSTLAGNRITLVTSEGDVVNIWEGHIPKGCNITIADITELEECQEGAEATDIESLPCHCEYLSVGHEDNCLYYQARAKTKNFWGI